MSIVLFVFGYHVKYFVNMFLGIHFMAQTDTKTGRGRERITSTRGNHANRQNSADIHVNYCHEPMAIATAMATAASQAGSQTVSHTRLANDQKW